jgi:hypothetical protein
MVFFFGSKNRDVAIMRYVRGTGLLTCRANKIAPKTTAFHAVRCSSMVRLNYRNVSFFHRQDRDPGE